MKHILWINCSILMTKRQGERPTPTPQLRKLCGD